ncbi:hypothetical protein JCM5350_007304 [Sporobolomyces pararoseus]
MVQSDSVLGGSKVEEYRSREALKAVTGSKSKAMNKTTKLSTNRPPPPTTFRVPGMKRKSSTSTKRGGGDSSISSSSDEGGRDGGESAIYDPFRKVKKKQKQ